MKISDKIKCYWAAGSIWAFVIFAEAPLWLLGLLGLNLTAAVLVVNKTVDFSEKKR